MFMLLYTFIILCVICLNRDMNIFLYVPHDACTNLAGHYCRSTGRCALYNPLIFPSCFILFVIPLCYFLITFFLNRFLFQFLRL